MPSRGSKNVVQIVIEFPPDAAQAVRSFAHIRGQTVKDVVLHALRRHIKYPPPPPDPNPTEPLPPCDEPLPAPKKPAKPPARWGRKA